MSLNLTIDGFVKKSWHFPGRWKNTFWSPYVTEYYTFIEFPMPVAILGCWGYVWYVSRLQGENTDWSRNMQHHGCMVDILNQARRSDEAQKLIELINLWSEIIPTLTQKKPIALCLLELCKLELYNSLAVWISIGNLLQCILKIYGKITVHCFKCC